MAPMEFDLKNAKSFKTSITKYKITNYLCIRFNRGLLQQTFSLQKTEKANAYQIRTAGRTETLRNCVDILPGCILYVTNKLPLNPSAEGHVIPISCYAKRWCLHHAGCLYT